MDADGFLLGKSNRAFGGSPDWCCLTGTAQVSIMWPEVTSRDLSLRGGVPGSWPVWGPCGRFRILNWATKFFLDALLARATVKQ